MSPLPRIFSIATTLFLGGGLFFYILGPLLNDSWKEMMLSDLAVTCILMAILTGLAGALLELLHKTRTKHRAPDPPTSTDTSVPE